MNFRQKKLTPEQILRLHKVPISRMKAHALIPVPAYVHLKTNNKYLAVKAPLDFFEPKELKKLSSYTYLYFLDFLTQIAWIEDIGRRIKTLLNKKEIVSARKENKLYPEIFLPPAPYEISDSILRMIGPMWWYYPEYGPAIEPYFVTILVNEICAELPPELMLEARNKSIESYEQALCRSSWCVFTALLLGYTSYEFLNRVRVRSFLQNIRENEKVSLHAEEDELIQIANLVIRGNGFRLVRANLFLLQNDRTSFMLIARLNRIRRDFISKGGIPPSIFGQRGFFDG